VVHLRAGIPDDLDAGWEEAVAEKTEQSWEGLLLCLLEIGCVSLAEAALCKRTEVGVTYQVTTGTENDDDSVLLELDGATQDVVLADVFSYLADDISGTSKLDTGVDGNCHWKLYRRRKTALDSPLIALNIGNLDCLHVDWYGKSVKKQRK